MTGDRPRDEDSPAGNRPVFGDFWQQATLLLRRPGRPGLQSGPQQALDMTFAMRRVVTVLSRYLDDLRICTPGVPDAWVHALTESRKAISRAAAALNCEECIAAWPALREAASTPVISADSLAGRLYAAAAALTAGRDLLQTHFTPAPAGPPLPHSDWAQAITSAAVSRALLAGLAAHAAAAAPAESGPLVPPRDAKHGEEEAAWRHIRTASRNLRALSRAVEVAQQDTPALGEDMRLLQAIPLNILPEHRMPAVGEQVQHLCAGAVESVHRAGRALRDTTERARWAEDLTAESFRQIAASCVVTGINCEVILRSLGKRARHLRLGHLMPDLNDAADAAAGARHAWLTAARAWDQLRTDSSGRLSSAAVEAAHLALWTGRIAYADRHWTPARGLVPARAPDTLAPDAAAFGDVISVTHYTADFMARAASAGQDQILAAAGAGRLYLPARPGSTLEYHFSRHGPAPLATAPGSRIEAVFAMYAHSAAASQAISQAAGRLAGAVSAESSVLTTAARHVGFAQHLSEGSQAQRSLLELGITDPALLQRAAAAGRDALTAAAREAGFAQHLREGGQVQRSLLELGITDPALLQRAAMVDRAALRVLAEAHRAAIPRPPRALRPGGEFRPDAADRQHRRHARGAEDLEIEP